MKTRLLTAAAAIAAALAAVFALSCIPLEKGNSPAPKGYDASEYAKIAAFLEQRDDNGVTNGEKISPDYDPDLPKTWSRDIGGGETYGFLFRRYFGKYRLDRVRLDRPDGGDALVGILDVSDCVLLESLSASNNDLKSVDASGCIRLKELRLVSCGVSTLFVSDCTMLSSFEATGDPLLEFAFNRTPLMRFSHIYAVSDGTVGYIQKDGSSTLFAVPDEGHAFSGWYTAKAELISREEVLDAAKVKGLIVSAKFRAPGPQTPEITVTNDHDSGKPTVSWEKVPAAAYYSVARSEYKYSEFKTIGISQGTSYIDRTAEPGTAYYYHVTAVSPIGRSEPSFPRERTCDLARPQVSLKHVAETGQNKLVWDDQPAAVGYEVYRSAQKDGNYSLIATLTGTSFTDTDPAPGMTYYYKVRALAENSAADSAKTRAHSITCDLPRPTVSALRNDDGTVTLTWERIDSAAGYEVFRSETEDGEYVSVAVTEETSFTDHYPVSLSVYYKTVALHTDPMANSAKSKPVFCEAIELPVFYDD